MKEDLQRNQFLVWYAVGSFLGILVLLGTAWALNR